MRFGLRKLFVVAMLTLCVGTQLLEVSGRWDKTIRDANDEAGVVAIVLCLGAALGAAAALLKRIRRSHVVVHLVLDSSARLEDRRQARVLVPHSPPLQALRV